MLLPSHYRFCQLVRGSPSVEYHNHDDVEGDAAGSLAAGGAATHNLPCVSGCRHTRLEPVMHFHYNNHLQCSSMLLVRNLMLAALLLGHLAPSQALRGTRLTVHNETPNLLRIVSSSTYKDHDGVRFLSPNASVVLQGYQGGKIDPDDESTNNGYDVTFTIQRFCPGITDVASSTLQDGYRDLMYVIANNHWVGEPYMRMYLDCSYYPPDSPQYVCKSTSGKQTFGEGEGRPVDFSGPHRSFAGFVRRTGDDDDYKQFDMYIHTAPHACAESDEGCASDWRAPYCNAD